MTPIVWLTRLLVGAYPQWDGCTPSKKQRIYFANHTSRHLDTIVIWTSLPSVLRGITRPVAAKDYWDHGLFRKRIAMKELNVVLIDRHRKEHADPLGPLKQALRDGDSLIIFPEGTPPSPAAAKRFKSGLASDAQVPDVELIPVYIENLHRAMPKGVIIPVPTICSVRFGAPLEHDVTDTKEDFLTRARQAVIDLGNKISRRNLDSACKKGYLFILASLIFLMGGGPRTASGLRDVRKRLSKSAALRLSTPEYAWGGGSLSSSPSPGGLASLRLARCHLCHPLVFPAQGIHRPHTHQAYRSLGACHRLLSGYPRAVCPRLF